MLNVKLKPYVSLIKSRVFLVIVYSLNVILALIASSKLNGSDIFTFGRNLVHSLLSIVPIVLSVYIFNDLTDIKIDKINKLDRPLVNGGASKNEARKLVNILGIFGLAVAFTINLRVFLFSLTYFILFTSYSFPPIRLKGKFLINKLTVGIGTFVTYLIGGAVAGEIPVPVFLMAIYGFVGSFSTSVVIDLRDIGGDKIYEVKTMPVTWSPNITVRFAMALISLLGVAITIVFFYLGFNIAFLMLLICGFVAWIYVLYPLLNRWNEPSYVENTVHKKVTAIGMFLQSLIVLGAFI